MNEQSPKKQIRVDALKQRRLIPRDVVVNAGEVIARRGLEIVRDYAQPGAVVSAYWAINNEMPTRCLLETLLQAGYRVALPLFSPPCRILRFKLWEPGQSLKVNVMGLAQPDEQAIEVEPDFFFVPLVAFDSCGHRIGFGWGNYDATLASLRAKRPRVAVGLAFDLQEVSAIPAEAHDEKLNFVLTETRLFSFGGLT